MIIILRFDSILEYHVLMRTLINALNPGDIVALIFVQFFTIIEYHVLVRALMSCRYLRSCDERWFDTVGWDVTFTISCLRPRLVRSAKPGTVQTGCIS